jgi:hypothetical protein
MTLASPIGKSASRQAQARSALPHIRSQRTLFVSMVYPKAGLTPKAAAHFQKNAGAVSVSRSIELSNHSDGLILASDAGLILVSASAEGRAAFKSCQQDCGQQHGGRMRESGARAPPRSEGPTPHPRYSARATLSARTICSLVSVTLRSTRPRCVPAAMCEKYSPTTFAYSPFASCASTALSKAA